MGHLERVRRFYTLIQVWSCKVAPKFASFTQTGWTSLLMKMPIFDFRKTMGDIFEDIFSPII